jgi:hypothetical protein
MRVINDSALKVDIDNMFDSLMGREVAALRNWFKSAWQKQLIKADWFKDRFLHKIEAIGGKGMFSGLNANKATCLEYKVNGRALTLKDYTEYDIKDARAGLLWFYAPTTHSLNYYRYLDDIILVRDYLMWKLDDNPEADLRRLNAEDTLRAAQKWHADAARRAAEEARREALRRQKELEALSEEQRKRVEALGVKSVRDWDTMKEGRDWKHVADFNAAGVDYTVIRLTSSKACLVESEHMAHCTYLYKDRIFDSETVLLSVRETKHLHKPLVTAELHSDPMHIIQIKPFHNGKAHIELGLPAMQLPAGVEEFVSAFVMRSGNKNHFEKLSNPLQFKVEK